MGEKKRKPRRTKETEAQSQTWISDALEKSGLWTPRALEKEVYPERFSSRELGGSNYSYAFESYATGAKPAKTVILDVEGMFQGTAKTFFHPLWPQIRKSTPITYDNARVFFSQLPTEITSLFNLSNTGSFKSSPFGYRNSIGKALVKMADLDSLSALFVIWQLATTYENWPVQREVATNIYRLLIVYSVLKFQYYFLDLFKIFRSKVFEPTNWEEYSFQLSSGDFFDTIDVLQYLTGSAYSASIAQRNSTKNILSKVLWNRHLHLPAYAVANNYLHFNDNALPPKERTFEYLRYCSIRGVWALDYCHGVHTRSLVDRIFAIENLSASQLELYSAFALLDAGNKDIITERVELQFED